MSPLRFVWRPRVGPFRLNISRHGVRSVSTKLGPLTVNSRTGVRTLNLPGPFSFSWGGRRG